METKEWFQKSKRFLNKEQILMQKKPATTIRMQGQHKSKE